MVTFIQYWLVLDMVSVVGLLILASESPTYD